jgi:hypothetical protein
MLLLLSVWLLVLGYTLIFHGSQALSGSKVSFQEALLGPR